MRTTQQAAALLVFAALSGPLVRCETFSSIDYLFKPDGKDKGEQVGGVLNFDGPGRRIIFQSKKVTLDVPVGTITGALYERSSKPRYAAGLLIAWPLLFTKSKQHYLTFQYKADNGEGKYAVFHLDKRNYREVVAAAEASIGKKVERSEER